MNAPVLTEHVSTGARIPATAEWQYLVPPLALGLLLLGALFNQEIVAAVETWTVSTAYNHCYLVIPISLYLLWDRRFDLVGIRACPMPAALLLGFPLAIAWLVAERLGIMEGRQLIAVSFVQVLFLAVLGKRLWWAAAGPLLYLYFLVPFGEFLTPRLQTITTWFIGHGLDILGIPAYIDGYEIEIPQGKFFVAEACAGLRFLVASIAFGCLYALVMYRGPVRRGVFILISIIVPVVANGFRGLGIVCLGYLLNSAQAAAADHLIYGWIFFSIVILLLILLGLPFRQDQIPTRSAVPQDRPNGQAFPTRAAFTSALGLAAIAATTPAVAASLTFATANPPLVTRLIDLGPDCSLQPAAPVPPSSPRTHAQRAVCQGTAMDITWETFSPRITAAPVMAERRRLIAGAATEDMSESWLQSTDGTSSAWRITRSTDPAFIIAVSLWVDGKPARPGLPMRARMAMNSMFGSAYTPVVVTVTPAVDWGALTATTRANVMASLSTFLLAHPELDAAIGTLSAVAQVPSD